MLQPGRVLVVDDRESNRELLKDMLEGAGHLAMLGRQVPSSHWVVIAISASASGSRNSGPSTSTTTGPWNVPLNVNGGA